MSNERGNLEQIFQELRDAEAATAPQFESLLKRSRTASHISFPRLAVATLALLLTIGGIAWNESRSRHDHNQLAASPLLSTTQWHAPTDVLLITPRNDLLDSVPSFRLTTPQLPTTSPGGKS